ncbi:MAG: MerR family transcriptional regulator [Rhodobacteraceae bacterium]|nr:MerR family transcriptional regulator [Paracoccaceae bacterium]MBR28683.1 MerR family transcriptional regulator [Paracoccaceae bacterium]
MDKSPAAFRTISEVSETLDVPAHVLRFWESKFPAVKPVKRGGGRRYYRPEDVTLLVGIRELLYDDGLTIKGVQKIFREKGARHVTRRGAEHLGEALPEDAAPAPGPAPAPEAEAAPDPALDLAPPAPARAPEPAPPATESATTEAEPDPAPAPADPDPADAERIRAAISRLEALRDRLRSEPAPRG